VDPELPLVPPGAFEGRSRRRKFLFLASKGQSSRRDGCGNHAPGQVFGVHLGPMAWASCRTRFGNAAAMVLAESPRAYRPLPHRAGPGSSVISPSGLVCLDPGLSSTTTLSLTPSGPAGILRRRHIHILGEPGGQSGSHKGSGFPCFRVRRLRSRPVRGCGITRPVASRLSGGRFDPAANPAGPDCRRASRCGCVLRTDNGRSLGLSLSRPIPAFCGFSRGRGPPGAAAHTICPVDAGDLAPAFHLCAGRPPAFARSWGRSRRRLMISVAPEPGIPLPSKSKFSIPFELMIPGCSAIRKENRSAGRRREAQGGRAWRPGARREARGGKRPWREARGGKRGEHGARSGERE